MTDTVIYTDEKRTSQMDAVIQLINMGYTYLTHEQIRQYRKNNEYILTDITTEAMKKINGDKASDKSIAERINALKNIQLSEGIMEASYNVYSMLISGESVDEYNDSKKDTEHIYYIDFSNINNNLFHFTVEFIIDENKVIRPDIVIFVNGIPLAVIENKKASVSIDEAIEQHIRNQNYSEIPAFYIYTQILIATKVTDFKYATFKSSKEHYSLWKEKLKEDRYNDNLLETINKKIDKDLLNNIISDLGIEDYIQKAKTVPTVQDIGIYGVLRKERLMDIIHNFILYDSKIKKICRYNQYFAVRKTFERIKTRKSTGERNGGVIWHTQGSGKSLTMVALAKLLFSIDSDVKIVVVTDRVDLDDQISATFANNKFGVGIKNAKSGKDLIEKLKKSSVGVVTTIINKFNDTSYSCDNDNIFIFIDEAHRSQYGIAHQIMKKVLPKACIIGFTGTPILTDKNRLTLEKFGGIIDEYKLNDAEDDKVIVELIYQGRYAEQHVNKDKVDAEFEKITKNLTEKQKQDLMQKYNSSTLVHETQQNIIAIASDIREHFIRNFKNTGLKGQLVAPSKYSAVRFHEWFKDMNRVSDENEKINTAVIISDDKKISDGAESDDGNDVKYKVVKEFLDNIKKEKSLKKYEKDIIQLFKGPTKDVELIIVVDKLLTGFDAPRNAVLYLTKRLENHNLMQAIARVNRVFDGDKGMKEKSSGLIVDYSSNAKNIKDAMQLFTDFDPNTMEAFLRNPKDIADRLVELSEKLNDIHKRCKDNNENGIIQFLIDENNAIYRAEFYENLSKFINTFNTCLALPDISDNLDMDTLNRYRDDLKKFVEIKKSTQLAMAETVDFSKYRNQIHRILDNYIQTDDVENLTEEIKINNVVEFNKYINNDKNGLSNKSKADAIAAHTRKVIISNYDKDPVFYKKFSEIIDDIIDKLKTAKESDVQSILEKAMETQKQVHSHTDNSESLPDDIKNNLTTYPYYRLFTEKLNELNKDEIVKLTFFVIDVVNENKVVDFEKRTDIKKAITEKIEDYLFDNYDNKISVEKIYSILEDIWKIAVANG